MDPTTLKRQRGVVKSSCTRVRTYLESLTDSITLSIVAQHEERKKRLDDCWSEYNALQSQLEAHDEAESSDRANFKETFITISAKIKELLRTPAQANIESIPSTSHGTTDSRSYVKLLKLNLPTFSGKYDKWYPFFNTFQAVIHSNSSLNTIQTLQYLKTSLTGEAANVIESLEFSDANYDVA
ncbi:uncharacterized protein LOC120359350 [Solenopsis invicta]|uniref:uncharacterized protein LOC120359350 n=1 Tax=Solenopsis invicta TaxID=13686 RepID=UPI00193D1FD7|nr:uncharacterized protein LOC120359350 [Solenopsis invicta]